MTQTIVFIHGAWVTPKCWEPFRGYSRLKSALVKAVDWPHYLIAGPWLVLEGAQGNPKRTAATSE